MRPSLDNNKWCVWFGHAPESQGRDTTSDFASENFKCKRCHIYYAENAWSGPQQKPKIFSFLYRALVLSALLAFIYFVEI